MITLPPPRFPKLVVFVNSHLANTEEEPALFSDPDLELEAINYNHLRQRLNNHRIAQWTMVDHLSLNIFAFVSLDWPVDNL